MEISEMYKANLTEPIRLLNQLFYYKSFIYVSTSSVLLPNQTFYSLSKQACEQALKLWHDEHGGNIAIVRPSSVTGVGEQPQHLIPTLIRSCLYGEKMPFVPEPTHDFIDVSDFVKEVLFVSQHMGRYRGKILNLGFGRSHSNQEVLKLVEEVTKRKANIKLVKSLRNYDTPEWCVDDDLPFIPKKTLRQIIKEMVEWEKNK